MPTYQYSCTNCGEHLEAVQSFSDPALTVCPACQGRLRKVFNSVGVVFKGSGFYRNDSRAASTNGSSGTSGDSSSESKPDTASPATSTTSSSSKSDSSSSSSAAGSSAKAGAASS